VASGTQKDESGFGRPDQRAAHHLEKLAAPPSVDGLYEISGLPFPKVDSWGQEEVELVGDYSQFYSDPLSGYFTVKEIENDPPLFPPFYLNTFPDRLPLFYP